MMCVWCGVVYDVVWCMMCVWCVYGVVCMVCLYRYGVFIPMCVSSIIYSYVFYMQVTIHCMIHV